jgi:hypothetical protein
MKSRVIAGVALCGLVGLGLTIGGTVAAAAPTGGAIKVWVKPTPTGTTNVKHPGGVMITGAIGDYGTSVSENAAGKKVNKGPFKLLRLHKGNILVNATALNTATQNAFMHAAPNTTNCSIMLTASGVVTIVKGTGAYVGVTGSATFTVSYGAVLPKKKNGACTLKTSTKALATFSSFSGTGTVSFS